MQITSGKMESGGTGKDELVSYLRYMLQDVNQGLQEGDPKIVAILVAISLVVFTTSEYSFAFKFMGKVFHKNIWPKIESLTWPQSLA